MERSGAASTAVSVTVATTSSWALCAADDALTVNPPPGTVASSFAAPRHVERLILSRQELSCA